jgi:hypothetical protein
MILNKHESMHSKSHQQLVLISNLNALVAIDTEQVQDTILDDNMVCKWIVQHLEDASISARTCMTAVTLRVPGL